MKNKAKCHFIDNIMMYQIWLYWYIYINNLYIYIHIYTLILEQKIKQRNSLVVCWDISHSTAWTVSWWRHQMETFSALLALCEVNSPVTSEFPSQRPVARSLDLIFDPHLNKRLSKQSGRWGVETPSRSLWRHSNDHGFREDECCVVVTAFLNTCHGLSTAVVICDLY